MERITVFCSSAQDLQEWLEHLQPFTKGGSPGSTITKVRTPTHPKQRNLQVLRQMNTKSESCMVLKCDNSVR